LLEQLAVFWEAAEAWSAAPSIFAEQKRKVKNLLKSMGAYNGKRK